MSRDNVKLFVQQVAADSQLALLVKQIPAGPKAEAQFAALAANRGCAFTVDELKTEAAQHSGSAMSDPDSPNWVLDYFYGVDGKFA